MRVRDGMGGVIETCKDLDFLLKWDVVFMLKMDKVWFSSRGGVKRKYVGSFLKHKEASRSFNNHSLVGPRNLERSSTCSRICWKGVILCRRVERYSLAAERVLSECRPNECECLSSRAQQDLHACCPVPFFQIKIGRGTRLYVKRTNM